MVDTTEFAHGDLLRDFVEAIQWEPLTPRVVMETPIGIWSTVSEVDR